MPLPRPGVAVVTLPPPGPGVRGVLGSIPQSSARNGHEHSCPPQRRSIHHHFRSGCGDCLGAPKLPHWTGTRRCTSPKKESRPRRDGINRFPWYHPNWSRCDPLLTSTSDARVHDNGRRHRPSLLARALARAPGVRLAAQEGSSARRSHPLTPRPDSLGLTTCAYSFPSQLVTLSRLACSIHDRADERNRLNCLTTARVLNVVATTLESVPQATTVRASSSA